MSSVLEKPRLLHFPSNGAPSEGYLTVATGNTGIPFAIRRAFWTYFTPNNVTRGRHAHYETEMVIIAVHGRIRLSTELLSGELSEFVLEQPEQGLYLPPLCWHVMAYSHDAVQLVLASTEYNPADYIRSYPEFREIGRQHGFHRTDPTHL